MTTIRRTLTVISLMLAVVVGSSIPAAALYSSSEALSVPAATARVAAPASISIDDYCSTTTSWDWYLLIPVQTTHHWYTATITWPASTTARGVTGYRVMAHLGNGQSEVLGSTTATSRSVSTTVDRTYLDHQPRVSVITLTSYGWTAETPPSAVLAC